MLISENTALWAESWYWCSLLLIMVVSLSFLSLLLVTKSKAVGVFGYVCLSEWLHSPPYCLQEESRALHGPAPQTLSISRGRHWGQITLQRAHASSDVSHFESAVEMTAHQNGRSDREPPEPPGMRSVRGCTLITWAIWLTVSCAYGQRVERDFFMLWRGDFSSHCQIVKII